ncbi:von Willebrand factor type A domain-containing protein [Mycena sanguinolenta]|nr:von Willebrand factor type A domain-containing protein [Mycena sanguinolenta]
MSVPIYGLYYVYQHRFVSLPLLGVCAEASIKELAAQVKLTQTYGNDAGVPIEAKYTFPIPARASVCSFVMVKQDGTRVVGSVLEKQEARETYDTAVAQGKQASLAEQQTPDVFQVSVGNIPPNEQVQIELVYATELSEDEENDSIRFHLPVHIGARYGQGPQSKPSPFPFIGRLFVSSSSPAPFLTLAMSVEAIAPISKIGCPSHSVSTELGPDTKLPNFKELPFSNYARVSLLSDSPLDKDFVLTVKSAGLDTPRCVAELHPAHDTMAMGLTLVPRFTLPEVSRQEFVFMVDRSGSMGGKRIEAARKALVVMLRALPHEDALFQIVSFGNRSTSLWPHGSKPYNQETLEEATRHVDSMKADYGGTEIAAALQNCFATRKMDRPLSLLVLTDGDAWALDRVLGEVRGAVEKAPKDAYVRVSVLGIGNSASTAMCEGMARVGNGVCMMVREEETSFTGKIARMLKAAKMPPISNISVDWGQPPSKEKEASPPDYDDFEIVEAITEKRKEPEKKTLNIFDESSDDPIQIDSTPAPPPPPVVLPDFPAVQQAPFAIQNLFPSIRLNVYAILQGKTIPKTVIIRGTTAGGASIELPIPVALSHLQNTPGAPPAMHALAARKIIQDLEDGKHALTATLANPDDTDLLKRTVKASIVRLGKTYSVASTHTSFVAVDETKRDPVPSAGVAYVVQKPAPASGMKSISKTISRAPCYAPVRMAASVSPSADRLRGSLGGTRRKSSSPSLSSSASVAPSSGMAQAELHSIRSGAPASTSSASVAPASPCIKDDVQSETLSPEMEGEMESAERHKGSERRAMPKSSATWSRLTTGTTGMDTLRGVALGSDPISSQSGGARARGAPPPSFPDPFAPPSAKRRSNPRAPPSIPQPRASMDPLEALARLQSFDGCFSLGVLSVIALKSNVGIEAVRAVFPAGASDGVIASVLAMVFLANKLGAGVERDSWEGMYEKARRYVEAALQKMGATETAEGLEAKVVPLLA